VAEAEGKLRIKQKFVSSINSVDSVSGSAILVYQNSGTGNENYTSIFHNKHE
jgi:hypothetical protein